MLNVSGILRCFRFQFLGIGVSFSKLCVFFVAPLSGLLGWDLYLVVVYMVVTGEAPYEAVLV